jgi:hypothetical protein
VRYFPNPNCQNSRHRNKKSCLVPFFLQSSSVKSEAALPELLLKEEICPRPLTRTPFFL